MGFSFLSIISSPEMQQEIQDCSCAWLAARQNILCFYQLKNSAWLLSRETPKSQHLPQTAKTINFTLRIEQNFPSWHRPQQPRPVLSCRLICSSWHWHACMGASDWQESRAMDHELSAKAPCWGGVCWQSSSASMGSCGCHQGTHLPHCQPCGHSHQCHPLENKRSHPVVMHWSSSTFLIFFFLWGMHLPNGNYCGSIKAEAVTKT